MSFFDFLRRAVAVLSLSLAVCASAVADEAPLTLDAAVALAVRNSPLLDADSARVVATRDDAVRAGRLPDPELSVGIANLPVQGPGAFTAGADAMTMRTVGLMQRIPARAVRDAERALARAGVDAAAAARIAAAENVRQSVATAWISRWAADRRRALLAELRDEATTAVDASRARLAGGTGSASDALAARGELAALDARIDAAESADNAAQAELSRWLGDAAVRPLADPSDFSALPVAPARLLAQLDRQAALLLWSARERAADAAVDAARAGKKPQWSIAASYGVRAAGLPDMAMIEVGLSLPLFAGNRQDRAIGARLAERDAVADEHEDALRAQRSSVEQELAQWQGWTRQVQRFRDQRLPLARDRTRAALAAYRGGGELRDWLDARRDEIDLRLAYADALEAWGRAWAALAYLMPAEDTP